MLHLLNYSPTFRAYVGGTIGPETYFLQAHPQSAAEQTPDSQQGESHSQLGQPEPSQLQPMANAVTNSKVINFFIF